MYLQRLANPYNGFNFLVCVENMNYAETGKLRRYFPKHMDLCAVLEEQKKDGPQMYMKLYNLLKRVFKCHDVTDTEMASVVFNTGFKTVHII